MGACAIRDEFRLSTCLGKAQRADRIIRSKALTRGLGNGPSGLQRRMGASASQGVALGYRVPRLWRCGIQGGVKPHALFVAFTARHGSTVQLFNSIGFARTGPAGRFGECRTMGRPISTCDKPHQDNAVRRTDRESDDGRKLTKNPRGAGDPISRKGPHQQADREVGGSAWASQGSRAIGSQG